MKKLLALVVILSSYVYADVCINNIINNSTSTIYKYSAALINPGQSVNISRRLKVGDTVSLSAFSGVIKEGQIVHGVGSFDIFFEAYVVRSEKPPVPSFVILGKKIPANNGAAYNVSINDTNVQIDAAGMCSKGKR